MARGLQSFRQLQRPVGDELVDIGILQDIGDFPQAELEIDRNRNGAERGNREIGADVLGPVAGKDAGAVAAAQSGGIQAAAAGSEVNGGSTKISTAETSICGKRNASSRP